MKQQRKVTYIQIAERRTLYSTKEIVLHHTACVQEIVDGHNVCRVYDGISEASILRLAKIQEKLAE